AGGFRPLPRRSLQGKGALHHRIQRSTDVMTALFWAGAIFSTLVLVPSAFFMVECLAARRPRRPELIPLRAPRVVVLMPAHDEEQSLPVTLSALLGVLDRGMSLLVVADNCTDRTSEIAREHGARVVVRDDPARVG